MVSSSYCLQLGIVRKDSFVRERLTNMSVVKCEIEFKTKVYKRCDYERFWRQEKYEIIKEQLCIKSRHHLIPQQRHIQVFDKVVANSISDNITVILSRSSRSTYIYRSTFAPYRCPNISAIRPLPTILWSYNSDHHNSSRYGSYNCGSMPRVSYWGPWRRFHLLRFIMCSVLLSNWYIMLSVVKRETLWELWSQIWINLNLIVDLTWPFFFLSTKWNFIYVLHNYIIVTNKIVN